MQKKAGGLRRKMRWLAAVFAVAFLVEMMPYPSKIVLAEGVTPDENLEETLSGGDSLGQGGKAGTTNDPEVIVSDDGKEITTTYSDENGSRTVTEREETDDDGNVISSTSYVERDADGNVTGSGYDAVETDQDGYVTERSIRYDADGNITESNEVTKNANGTVVYESATTTNEDGSETTVNIEYDEDGNKTGSTEYTESSDGTESIYVYKDADGNVYETEKDRTETDEEGNTIHTNVICDADGNVMQRTTDICSADGNEYISVKTDGDGNVIETIVEYTLENEDGSFSELHMRRDEEGNLSSYELSKYDEDGNLISATNGYQSRDIDGNVTQYMYETGANGETVYSYECTWDEDHHVVSEKETVYHEDGSHTSTDIEYDADGNKTGSTVHVYDQNGMAIRTESRDADDELTEVTTSSTERDENGNTIFVSTTSDGDGNVIRRSTTTMDAGWTNISMVVTDGDGNVIASLERMSEAGDRLITETSMSDMQGVSVQGLTIDLAKKVCTPEELEAYEAGERILLSLTATAVDEDVAKEDKTLVDQALQKATVNASGVRYYDISLYKALSGNAYEKVTDTGSSPVTITAELPADMINSNADVTRTFYVVRVQGGASDILAQTTENEVTFSSDLFSTYAIAYQDVKSGKGGDDDDDDDDETNDAAVTVAAQNTAYVTSPKTGEETSAGGVLFLIALAGAACLTISRRYEKA